MDIERISSTVDASVKLTNGAVFTTPIASGNFISSRSVANSRSSLVDDVWERSTSGLVVVRVELIVVGIRRECARTDARHAARAREGGAALVGVGGCFV